MAELISIRVKASREAIEKALVGYWREEYFFELQQCNELYWEKIRRTDEEIAKLLAQTPKDDAVDWDKYRAHLTCFHLESTLLPGQGLLLTGRSPGAKYFLPRQEGKSTL